LELLIEGGTEVTGRAIAESVIGFCLLGEPGAAVGFFKGAVKALWTLPFKMLSKEFKERYLSKREKTRIGTICIYALKKIEENLLVFY